MAKAAKPIMKITGSFMVDWELKELFKKKVTNFEYRVVEGASEMSMTGVA